MLSGATALRPCLTVRGACLRISRIRISNFTNFADLDIATDGSIVIVGENKVGKSNLVRALQLVLDPGLSERDRQLGLEHFWDGLGDHKLGAMVEVAVEFTDFTDDPRLTAHLADCVVVPGPPMVARLTYRFQPKPGLGRLPKSLAEYEYVVFGGDDPDMAVGASLRRMMPLDVQGALRDAEKDLATWRRSPLRPLIEELTAGLDEPVRAEIQARADGARDDLVGRPEVLATADRIGNRLIEIAGQQHAVPVTLGLTPTRVEALLRGLRILIDGGARGVPEASLGTANLIFLALKSLELDQLVAGGERDHTFFAVEEPESHLHPHVQRLVYRYFLRGGATGGASGAGENLTTILTTHSPHIASVSPVRSIVLLRHNLATQATVGVSAAAAPLSPQDEADLQRYIDVTRGEIFFARGVVLVEGDAERFLVPAFAEALGIPLDVLGISVCSVGGTNFAPFVKLLGPAGLAIPHVVLTDLDPANSGPPRARRRLIELMQIVDPGPDYEGMDVGEVVGHARAVGYFVNASTLEPELFRAGLADAMRALIEQELPLRIEARQALQGWVANPTTLDEGRLLATIDRIGKGRFAQSLAQHVIAAACPDYICDALERIRDAVA